VDTTKINHISLCAGYGGIDLGLSRAIPNLRTIAFSEIEAFACANLVAKMEAGLLDAAPIWTNLKTFPWSEFCDKVDILSGGYPCQPFSAAGKRLGKEDPRHLWPWIADGIRIMRPRICFFENVEGHISLGLREVISELESLGYQTTWGIFSAREVGAPHQRKRVFILAHRKSEGLEGYDGLLARCYESRRDSSEQEGQAGWSNSCGNAWPSRPGQPQHGWEPPRVVGNSKHNGSHQCSEETRGSIIRSEQRGMQESEGGSSSMGDTKHDGSLGLPECRGSHQDCNRSEEGTINAIESEGAGRSADCGYLPENQGGVMGNSTDERSSERRYREIPESRSKQKPKRSDASPERQTKPSLGGDADGATDRMGHAELFITSDNRTDELRLLGNGVVPATATRAFIVLINQLLNQ